MKKFLVAISFSLLTSFASASSSDSKIDLIQTIYDDESSIYENYSTQSLHDLLNNAFDANQMCLDYDPTIQGQDKDNFSVLSLAEIDDETVEANIVNGGEQSTVQYKVICDENGCQIDDIIDQFGSLREIANDCINQH